MPDGDAQRLEELEAYTTVLHAQANDLGEQLNILAELYSLATGLTRGQINHKVALEREKRSHAHDRHL